MPGTLMRNEWKPARNRAKEAASPRRESWNRAVLVVDVYAAAFNVALDRFDGRSELAAPFALPAPRDDPRHGTALDELAFFKGRTR
jgi:hypothetical protein